MSRKKLIFIAAMAVASIGTAAFAAPIIDTLLTEGYDDQNHILLYGVSSVDAEDAATASLDCTLDGTYDYKLAADTTVTTSATAPADDDDTDAKKDVEIIAVEELTQDGTAVEFNDEDPGNADAAVAYAADGECGLSAIDVTGPNGQVNHGSIVSAFVHALKEQGIKGAGCLIRTIAGSDYGKGDQQVTVDGDDTTEVVVTTTDGTGSAEMSSTEASCEHGKPADAGKPESNGNKPTNSGKPEQTGRPADAGSQGHGRNSDD